MNGNNKRIRYNLTLALSVLGGIGLASFALPTLGSNQVNVNVSPTTGYYSVSQRTHRVPPNMRVGPAPVEPTVTRIPNGGLSQSLPSGIEITGVRASGLLDPPQTLTGSMTSSVRGSLGALRNAGARCFTSFRCNLALTVGAAGIGELFDALDWVMTDGAIMKREVIEPDNASCPSTSYLYCIDVTIQRGALSNSPPITEAQCLEHFLSREDESPLYQLCERRGGQWDYVAPLPSVEYNRTKYYYYARVPGALYAKYTRENRAEFRERMLTPPEIEAGFSNYTPDPSDWNFLTGGLDLAHPGVDVEVVDLPSLSGANQPNYTESSDGTSQASYSAFDFSLSDNPGKQPEISVREETTTTNYDPQGNATSSTTSVTNVSGGVAASPSVDIPTDCEFMPTVCRFIDWFTEPDALPDPDQEIRDLIQVYEDGGRQVVVGPSSGSCPPPRTIGLSLAPSVSVSFQPFCDLAAAVRYWLLAIAYFGAAYLTVRSI